jgi:hypothetical protein
MSIAGINAVEYKQLGKIHEGLASALTTDDEWVVIDKKGTVIFSLSEMGLEHPAIFVEGLLAASPKNSNMRGFVNREGEIVIPPVYTTHSSPVFSDGLCVVQVPSSSPEIYGKFGCIRTDGSFAIPPVYDRLTGFVEGRAFGYQEGIGWLLLDQTGRVVNEKIFEMNRGFSEGLAAVRINGLWGYIDRDGEWKILPRYDNACTFREGYAGVLLDGYGGFINRDGDMVFERVCVGLGPGNYLYFKEGRAIIVEISEGKKVKYGYFINDGRRIPAIHDMASDFSGGFGRVMIDGRKRLIDENGSWVAWADGIDMLCDMRTKLFRKIVGKSNFLW